jgi:hypothetical protein
MSRQPLSPNPRLRLFDVATEADLTAQETLLSVAGADDVEREDFQPDIETAVVTFRVRPGMGTVNDVVGRFDAALAQAGQ